jgi:uncharacterized membrane protein
MTNKMDQKPVLEQIKMGIIQGWNTPTLPEDFIKWLNEPYIRIFRVVGGVSSLIMLGGISYMKVPFPIYLCCIFISFLFLIFHFYISHIRHKHIRYLWISGQLEVRNSPFQRIGTLCFKALSCIKGVCEDAQPVGLVLGLMLGADEALKQGNKDPIFGPLLGSGIQALFPSENRVNFKAMIGKTYDEIVTEGNNIKQFNLALESLNEETRTGGISKAEFDELSKAFKEMVTTSSERQNELSKNITKLVEESKK